MIIRTPTGIRTFSDLQVKNWKYFTSDNEFHAHTSILSDDQVQN